MDTKDFFKVSQKREDLSISGIYKIQNKVNNKVYIGQSVNIYERWLSHISTSNEPNNPHYEYPLYRAFRKYDLSNFDFSILEYNINDKQMLDNLEYFYIKKYDCLSVKNKGYNQYDYIAPSVHLRGVTHEQLENITDDLLNSKLLKSDIADKYGIKPDVVREINRGHTYKRVDLTYPLRVLDDKSFCKEVDYPRYLKLCNNKKITDDGYSRKTKLPKGEDLVEELKQKGNSFTKLGKKYGVTEAAIRKYLERRDLPYSMNYYKQEQRKLELDLAK